MNLPPLDVAEILKRYGLRPDKRLGQNFLVDPQALSRVVAAAEIHPQDVVLEVGPGLGSLTRLLAQSARHVVAVELDRHLLPPLREVLAPFSNVQLITGDILDLDPGALMVTAVAPGETYLVVANIPYYITSALLRHLLEAEPQPRRMVLTVQREVAERITAVPGAMSLLALSVQVYGAVQVTARIPAGAFYPAPQVDSAIVRVDLYPAPRVSAGRLGLFFRLAKAGFSQRRKTLRNSLAGGMAWSKSFTAEVLANSEIDPQRRAETLAIEEWAALAEVVAGLPGENQSSDPAPQGEPGD